MVSYEKQSDFIERDTSMDTKDIDFRSTTPDASTFPDGGWRAWTVVLGV
jgi:hypothetical protein